MILSVKKFTKRVIHRREDKATIMKECVSGFKRINTSNTKSNLKKLGEGFKSNCVYSNITWRDDYRKKENAILDKIDMLIMDIDDGLRIDKIIDTIPFSIMTLTTTSHTEEHHKFRVFIPLKQTVTFKDNSEYKELLKLIDSEYFYSQSDKACFESGRAFITTEKAEYQINEHTNLLDCSALIKKATLNTLAEKLKSIPVSTYDSIKKYTIEDVKKFPKVRDIVSKFAKGNHYLPVYQIIGIGKRVGLSSTECAQLIMSYNIGNEYSDFNDLVKKANTY